MRFLEHVNPVRILDRDRAVPFECEIVLNGLAAARERPSEVVTPGNQRCDTSFGHVQHPIRVELRIDLDRLDRRLFGLRVCSGNSDRMKR